MRTHRATLPRPHSSTAWRAGRWRAATAAVAALLLITGPAGAQLLAPKRALSAPAATQCAGVTLPSDARRDPAAARVAAARARELALEAERTQARDAFARAAALDPADPQLAYDLGRAAEEAGDRTTAITALCRYLLLAPAGREAGEARSRLTRLVPQAPSAREAAARTAFARGVDALDARRFDQAAAAFDAVLRDLPGAPEAAFDRALARIGQGRDAEAAADLAAYVASPAAGSDRAQVLRAVEALRQPRWSPTGALGRGIVPGLGQLYTGRQAPGLAVLTVAAGGVAAAFVERRTIEQRQFRDEFGNSYSSAVPSSSRPYAAAGLAVAAGVTIAAAVEAAYYAASHRRERPRLQLRAAAVALPGPDSPLTPNVRLAAALSF